MGGTRHEHANCGHTEAVDPVDEPVEVAVPEGLAEWRWPVDEATVAVVRALVRLHG